jgi:hypothetical protein
VRWISVPLFLQIGLAKPGSFHVVYGLSRHDLNRVFDISSEVHHLPCVQTKTSVRVCLTTNRDIATSCKISFALTEDWVFIGNVQARQPKHKDEAQVTA